MLLGIYIKNYKSFKDETFIPVGNYNLVSYVGENGVGKSTILDILNTFFNEPNWHLKKNKFLNEKDEEAKNKEKGYIGGYICPIFVIDTDKFGEFNKNNNFFNNDEVESIFEFSGKIKDKEKKELEKTELNFKEIENKVVLAIGEKYYTWTSGKGEVFDKFELLNNDEFGRKILKFLKIFYKYVYIPVEEDLETFMKIGNEHMMKIMGNSIQEILKEVNIQKITDNLNYPISSKLYEIIEKIEDGFGSEYGYDGHEKKQKFVTNKALTKVIIDEFFSSRTFGKYIDKKFIPIYELSAGEKRILLLKFLKGNLKKRNSEGYFILGIDEPESSLNQSKIYEQFELLFDIADNSNNQVLFTTHWYGYLSITHQGVAHFLERKGNNNPKVLNSHILSAELSGIISDGSNFLLKSRFDLAQSILVSLKKDKPYNWIICEGRTDPIYINFLINKDKIHNLKIISLRGVSEVIRFYNILELSLRDQKKIRGKVACIIDTDVNTYSTYEIISNKHNNLGLITYLKKGDKIGLSYIKDKDKYFAGKIDEGENIKKEYICDIEMAIYGKKVAKNKKGEQSDIFIKNNKNKEEFLFIKELENFFK